MNSIACCCKNLHALQPHWKWKLAGFVLLTAHASTKTPEIMQVPFFRESRITLLTNTTPKKQRLLWQVQQDRCDQVHGLENVLKMGPQISPMFLGHGFQDKMGRSWSLAIAIFWPDTIVTRDKTVRVSDFHFHPSNQLLSEKNPSMGKSLHTMEPSLPSFLGVLNYNPYFWGVENPSYFSWFWGSKGNH